MDKTTISSWVRQARHRAKKHGIYNDLEIHTVEETINEYAGKCAYCNVKAETLDHPFPLKDDAPNVSANVLPSCKACKKKKKTNDLSWLFSKGYISKERYTSLLKSMLNKSGAEELKVHVRKVTGIYDE